MSLIDRGGVSSLKKNVQRKVFAMLVQHRGSWRTCKDPPCFKGEHTVRDFADGDVCDRGVPVTAVDKKVLKRHNLAHGS